MGSASHSCNLIHLLLLPCMCNHTQQCLTFQPLHAIPTRGPRIVPLTWLHVSAEEADSGGRHQHYMTQPKGRLQKGMRHRTDIPTRSPPSSGLEAGMTPAASIRRSTTMPQRWCIRHGSAGHSCARQILRQALCNLAQMRYAGSLTVCCRPLHMQSAVHRTSLIGIPGDSTWYPLTQASTEGAQQGACARVQVAHGLQETICRSSRRRQGTAQGC